MTTRIPIIVDDRSLGSKERSEVLFGLLLSGTPAACIGVMSIWEPLRTGDYHSVAILLIQALGVSTFVFFFSFWWSVPLTGWYTHSSRSVHVETACRDVVVQTVRLFGYSRITRISRTDVLSIQVRPHYSVDNPSVVWGYRVEASCKSTRHPVLIANLAPHELSQAEATAQRLRDALNFRLDLGRRPGNARNDG